MLTHHEEAKGDERWPRKHVDPELDEEMHALGARIPTRSLDRPRGIEKPRPAWLAFILRTAHRADAAVRRLLRKRERGADDLDDLGDLWSSLNAADRTRENRGLRREIDPAMDAWLRTMNIRPATHSLDHPRPVMNQLPAWLAILLNRLRLRS